MHRFCLTGGPPSPVRIITHDLWFMYWNRLGPSGGIYYPNLCLALLFFYLNKPIKNYALHGVALRTYSLSYMKLVPLSSGNSRMYSFSYVLPVFCQLSTPLTYYNFSLLHWLQTHDAAFQTLYEQNLHPKPKHIILLKKMSGNLRFL